MDNSYMNPEEAISDKHEGQKSPVAGGNSIHMTYDDTSMDTSVRTPNNQNEAHF